MLHGMEYAKNAQNCEWGAADMDGREESETVRGKTAHHHRQARSDYGAENPSGSITLFPISRLRNGSI